MALNLTKSYTPSSGQILDPQAYNVDISSLFNAFSGIENKTASLGGLKITAGSDDDNAKLTVTKADGTNVFRVYPGYTGGWKFDDNNSIWQLLASEVKTDTTANWIYTTPTTDRDGVFRVIYQIINGHGSSSSINVILNQSGAATQSQEISALNTTVSGQRLTSTHYITVAALDSGESTFGDMIIYAQSTEYPSFTLLTSSGGSAKIGLSKFSGRYYSGSQGFVKFDISSLDAAIGAGSVLQIFKRR